MFFDDFSIEHSISIILQRKFNPKLSSLVPIENVIEVYSSTPFCRNQRVAVIKEYTKFPALIT